MKLGPGCFFIVIKSHVRGLIVIYMIMMVFDLKT